MGDIDDVVQASFLKAGRKLDLQGFGAGGGF
jgi:hypothetical protein